MDLDKVTSVWQILPLTVGTRARHMLLGQGRETRSSGGHMQMYIAFNAAELFFLRRETVKKKEKRLIEKILLTSSMRVRKTMHFCRLHVCIRNNMKRNNINTCLYILSPSHP